VAVAESEACVADGVDVGIGVDVAGIDVVCCDGAAGVAFTPAGPTAKVENAETVTVDVLPLSVLVSRAVHPCEPRR
jgi:hypothetical protein